MKTLLLGVLLLVSTGLFAEKIPDENSKCYKQCLETRMACRKVCQSHQHSSNKTQLYACMDACDPIFNDDCVPKCPMIDNE